MSRKTRWPKSRILSQRAERGWDLYAFLRSPSKMAGSLEQLFRCRACARIACHRDQLVCEECVQKHEPPVGGELVGAAGDGVQPADPDDRRPENKSPSRK